jgi:translation initiation factor 1
MRLFAGTPWDQPPQCARCGKLAADCTCPPLPAPRTPPGDQIARVSVEKRKKGKLVTVISGLTLVGNDLPALLTQLKSECGAGGTLQGEDLEIQGDHRARIRARLSEMGYGMQR